MLKLGTVFSGIGAIEQDLIRLGIDLEIEFACDNGDVEVKYNHEEEFKKIQSMNSKLEKKKYVDDLYASKSRKQNYVKQSYLANYGDNISEDDFHLDVNLLDGTDYKDKVDLLVGGSPCQSFSAVGFRGGLEDARGTLFYEYARIVKEVNPKVFIYENVRGLTTHDHGNTWEIIKGIFKSLNYRITEPQILNAADYGIPQNRRRVFVVGIRNDIYVKKINHVKQDFHARYNVVSKEYEYLINLKKYNPLQRNYVYQYNRNLNIELIKKASLLFEGTHNFKTFTKTTREPKDYVRTINKITITYNNGILKLIFNGNGFLRYMVRNIVGTLISVGEEKTSINEIPEMFEKENRVYACKTAHPEGLYLKNVFYK